MASSSRRQSKRNKCKHWEEALRNETLTQPIDRRLDLDTKCLECYFGAQGTTTSKWVRISDNSHQNVLTLDAKKVIRAMVRCVHSTMQNGIVNQNMNMNNTFYHPVEGLAYISEQNSNEGVQLSYENELHKLSNFIATLFESDISGDVHHFLYTLNDARSWRSNTSFLPNHMALWPDVKLAGTVDCLWNLYQMGLHSYNDRIHATSIQNCIGTLASMDFPDIINWTDHFLSQLINLEAPKYFNNSLQTQLTMPLNYGNNNPITFEGHPLGILRYIRYLFSHGYEEVIVEDEEAFDLEVAATVIRVSFGEFLCKFMKDLFLSGGAYFRETIISPADFSARADEVLRAFNLL